MTDEERAEQVCMFTIASLPIRGPITDLSGMRAYMKAQIIDQLREARADGFRAAMSEAIRCAETCDTGAVWGTDVPKMRDGIVKALRSLIPPQESE